MPAKSAFFHEYTLFKIKFFGSLLRSASLFLTGILTYFRIGSGTQSDNFPCYRFKKFMQSILNCV